LTRRVTLDAHRVDQQHLLADHTADLLSRHDIARHLADEHDRLSTPLSMTPPNIIASLRRRVCLLLHAAEHDRL
jgi:hypothetical protein